MVKEDGQKVEKIKQQDRFKVLTPEIQKKIFNYWSRNIRKCFIQFKAGELLWIPFSAIITLLIIMSFVDHVNLTNDVILNLEVAFGFGFNFDKVLEAWKKAPTTNSTTTINT